MDEDEAEGAQSDEEENADVAKRAKGLRGKTRGVHDCNTGLSWQSANARGDRLSLKPEFWNPSRKYMCRH